MVKPLTKLSSHLPPLIFGTAPLNTLYNTDPYALNPTAIVQHALANGVRAFDTSPYYGPAEEILGTALATEPVRNTYPRDQYYILTKVGRVPGASPSFDYSADWVRRSVKRSCKRLRTTYLDVVYCHDIEFVTPEEVLGAVKELRKLRDEENTIKYVGVSGYPVDVLCEMAELVFRETGEPLDIVQSYANFTIQNTKLLSSGLKRLVAAGVDVVPNASILGMGLLRREGVPVGGMGNWHPAPDGLKQACVEAGRWAETQGEKLEVVAVRYAVERWITEAAVVGTSGNPTGSNSEINFLEGQTPARLGVSVMGVSTIGELDETIRVWRSVLDGLASDSDEQDGPMTPSDAISDREWSLQRRRHIMALANGIRSVIGSWIDFTWPSPEPTFVNLKPVHLVEEDDAVVENEKVLPAAATLPTPPSEAAYEEGLLEVPHLSHS